MFNVLYQFLGQYTCICYNIDIHYSLHVFLDMGKIQRSTVRIKLSKTKRIILLLRYFRDLRNMASKLLPDNQKEDSYVYEILGKFLSRLNKVLYRAFIPYTWYLTWTFSTVLTGSQSQATCKSKVQFILTGEKEESDIRTLPRITFQRGGIDSFVMTTRKSLGALQYLRIWHDNTGVGNFASWFLGAVIVRDLQTGDKYQFANDRWLAVEYGDGEVGMEGTVRPKSVMPN